MAEQEYYSNEPIAIFDDFFDAMHLLKPSEFMIFMVLRKIAHDRTTQYTSIRDISKISGLSAPTILNAIKNLEDKGCIQKHQHYDRETGSYSSSYTVHADPKKWTVFSQIDSQ